MTVEIRYTIATDFPSVCNRVNDKTVKAFTVLLDGNPVCIAGVTIEKDKFIAFSDVKEGLKAPKMTIWRTARRLAEKLRTLNLPAVAITKSGKFLESLGFEYVGECDEGKIYRI